VLPGERDLPRATEQPRARTADDTVAGSSDDADARPADHADADSEPAGLRVPDAAVRRAGRVRLPARGRSRGDAGDRLPAGGLDRLLAAFGSLGC
jgi:hypothetical protein